MGVGGFGSVPHTITKPQVAAGVVLAMVKLGDKRREVGQHLNVSVAGTPWRGFSEALKRQRES